MEHESAEESTGGDQAREPARVAPPLRIYHFFVGTACVAVYLAAMQAVINAANNADAHLVVHSPRGLLQSLVDVLARVAGGIALTGLVLLVAHRRRRLPFPKHPGEFLHVLFGFSVAVSFPVALVLVVIPLDQLVRIGPLGFWVLGATPAAVILVGCCWALRHTKGRRWKVLWLAMALSAVVTFFLPDSVRFVTDSLLVSAVLTVVVLLDRRDWLQRPWTHWLGVGLYLYADLLQILAVLVRALT